MPYIGQQSFFPSLYRTVGTFVFINVIVYMCVCCVVSCRLVVTGGCSCTLYSLFQIKNMLDEFLEKLPDEFNMMELTGKIPVEERTPYVTVALQETERMNGLTNEIRRTLKELNLGLKVWQLLHAT